MAAVQVGQQRVEAERMLVGACGALFGIAVGQHQGRVRIHDQQLDVGVGASRPRASAGMCPGGTQPGQSVRILGSSFDDPPGGRVEATGPNSSG
jgi:hypothetical protein